MSDLITIHHLTALVQDQARLLSAEPAQDLPSFNPVFPERNEHEFELDDERWSVSVERTSCTYVHRDTGRSVRIQGDHPSPFAFTPRGLHHFVCSLDEDTAITQLVVDNWVVANFRLGRLIAAEDHNGYYTFAR
ncbi:MAG: hypothetical protein PF961_12035 [Planctomycetota bacterium]|nr:hypothetical protein [Planctomycetota bacterium]